MFPLRDENPTLQASVVTFLLIGLNIFTWIVIQGLGTPAALQSSVCRFGLIAGEFLQTVPNGTDVPLGRGYNCIIDSTGRWLTLFSHMFMHGGWFHLIGNMWFLAVFGDNVEDAMGRFRFVIFYLLCGIAAAYSQMLVDPQSMSPMVGASGAIGGIMGAYAVLYPRTPVHMLVFLGFYVDRIIVPAYFMLGYWFFLQLISTLPIIGGRSGGVAFWAHIGGFVAGILLITFFKDKRRVDAHRQSVFRRWGKW